MRKSSKTMIVPLLIAMAALFGFIVKNNNQSNNEVNNSASEAKGSAIWTPVENLDNKTYGQGLAVELNLKKLIQDTDYAFRGIITKSQEYEVKWVDESGVLWGPYPSVELDVKIAKAYHGKSPIKGDVIKVYYPYSLNSPIEDSVSIEDNSEYIFLT